MLSENRPAVNELQKHAALNRSITGPPTHFGGIRFSVFAELMTVPYENFALTLLSTIKCPMLEGGSPTS